MPSAPSSIVLDVAADRLWIDGRAIDLRPKTWTVLRHLAERPGKLVSKSELLDLAWPETAVSEGILNKSIGELRSALSDDPTSPRFIETVSRRGFRWIGQARIVGAENSEGEAVAAAETGAAAAAEPATADDGFIGRSDELQQLEAAFERARSGKRQVTFVCGEAGAGKTTLIDRFLDGLQRRHPPASLLVARGECIEVSGQHEPYLPVFYAIERLVRAYGTLPGIVDTLRLHAPSWVAQIPSLAGSTAGQPAPGRMLRELMGLVDELSRDRVLVAVMEDMHWADLATMDVLQSIAKAREPARLLLVVTMRAAEAIVFDHPVASLSRELVGRRSAERIELSPFDEESLAAYLERRSPGLDDRGELAASLLAQTGGNPLFVRLVVDGWISDGSVVAGGDGRWSAAVDPRELGNALPDSLRTLLEGQLAAIPDDERAVLEVASVRLGEFHPASIAACLGMDVDDVESILRGLATRGQFLRACGTGLAGDMGVVDLYAFMHATVQQVVADGLAPSRRRRLHLAVAKELEREYSGRTRAVAPQLAAHFEAGGDVTGAVRNLREAACLAIRRDCARDAITMLERVLRMIEESPAIEHPDRERLATMRWLGHAHQLVSGLAAPQLADLWSRGGRLAESTEDARQQLVMASGLAMVHCVGGRLPEAEALVREALPKAAEVEEPGARQTIFFVSATVRWRTGAFPDAFGLFDAALALGYSADPVPGADFVAVLESQVAPVHALAGHVTEARRLAASSMQRSREHSHYSECVTAAMGSWALALVGDWQAVTPLAERTLEVALADGYLTWATRPLFLLGLKALRDGDVEGGIAKVRESFDGRRRDGHAVDHSGFLALYAEALLDAGRAQEAVAALDEAERFVAESGERYFDAELLRLRARAQGISEGSGAEIERTLREAVELAQARGIRWHALLAASDLAALLIERGDNTAATAAIEPVLAAIDGGGDLPAVQAARELLRRAQS